MAAIEKTTQQYWQGSALAKTMPYANILPKALHPSLIAHYNAPAQLLQIWLAHVQRQQGISQNTSALYFADFAHEDALLKSVFGQEALMPVQDSQRLLKFCELMRRQQLDALKQRAGAIDGVEQQLLGAKQAIAKLVCLVDRDLPAALALVDLQDMAGSLARLNQAFDRYIGGGLQGMADQLAQHDKVPVQSTSLAAVALKPMVIADLLLTATGHLNVGLIEILKQRFFDGQIPWLHHDKELRQTLDILAASPAMQNQIHAVVKPFSPHLPSNDWLRVSLKMAPAAPLDDRQAKQVVLAALLSDMRQGDVNSCFGTSVGMLMMDALKERALGDLSALVSRGKLTRAGHGDQQDFMPVLESGDSALQAEITLESTGKVVSGTGFIWESPGLLAACRQLGMPAGDVKGVMQQIILQIYAEGNYSDKDLLEVTPQSIIRRLIKAQVAAKLDRQSVRDLKNRALWAFSAETQCPLLSAWESCLAAMAESPSNKLVRSKIAKCLATVMAAQWPKRCLCAPAKETQLVQKVFSNVLHNSIQLRYDPQVAVQATGKGAGHAKMFGAFVLHELKLGNRSRLIKPVETPAQFKKFVLNQLKRTKQILVKANHQAVQQQLATVDGIQAFVSRPDAQASAFVKTAIRYYDVHNGGISDPLQVWRQLEHLPFRDASGAEALAIYRQAIGTAPGQPHTVRPKNGAELLKAFVAFGRERAQADPLLAADNAYQCQLETATLSAFKLTPDDPSVVGAMDPSQTVDEWIRAHIVQPGQLIAQQPMSAALKQKFEQAICLKILGAQLAPGFQAAAKKIPANYNTLSLYGGELQKLLLSMHAKPGVRLENALAKQMTELLLNDVLPPETAAVLTNAAVRLAVTDGGDQSIQPQVFACFYNPLSQAIELAILDEAGQRLSPLNQDEWVTYIPWELYGVKFHPSI